MNVLFTIIASLGLLIVLIELSARLWLRYVSRTYVWKPYTNFDITPDPAVLPELSPRTSFKANSLGLRGREAPTADRVFRVVACGGSAVECFSLDESEAWPALVEKHLSEPAAKARLGVDDVHVLNFAKSGFTNESLGYLFPRVLDRVGPIDVLTITTGTAAVNAWTKSGTPADGRVQGNAWDDVHWHTESDYGLTLGTCATSELVRRAVHIWKRPVIQMRNTGNALASGRRARAQAREIRTSTPDTSAWIADYEASLGALILSAQRYARRVVLLRQSWLDNPNPTPDEQAHFWHGFLGDAAPGKREIFYSQDVFLKLTAEITAATVRVANRYNVETLSLAEAVAPNLENYYDIVHYTPTGARRVGAYVAAELLKQTVTKPATAEPTAILHSTRPAA
jgi:hypothetical protein